MGFRKKTKFLDGICIARNKKYLKRKGDALIVRNIF